MESHLPHRQKVDKACEQKEESGGVGNVNLVYFYIIVTERMVG
jgi:hypothetical protein